MLFNNKERNIMAIQRYRPITLFDRLQQGVPSLFDITNYEPNFDTEEWSPAVDITETENEFVIHADLPGVKPDDIEITAENGVLTLRGERESRKEEEKDNYKRVERFSGSFMRRFTLPDTADLEKIVAKSKNGVLDLTIPKTEKAKPKLIKVKVDK
jgi:HSP20 family protein